MTQGNARVTILSSDSLLRELLGDLLRHEGLAVVEADSVLALAETARVAAPAVVVIDSVDDPELGAALLSDPWSTVGDPPPALVLLAGSATPAEIVGNTLLDCVLMPPLETRRVVHAVRAAAAGTSRPPVRSGVQLRAALAAADPKRHAN